MKKRNIHIIPSLGYGGAETFLIRLIPLLNRNNTIITFYKTDYDKNRIKGKNLSYITLDPFRTSLKDIFAFLKLIFSLDKNDIIFSWLYISDIIASIIKCLLFWKKFKLYWNVRNTIITKREYSFLTSLSFFLSKKLFMKIPNRIIFNSYKSMEDHINNGYSKEKSITIHNGYERLSKISVPKKNKNIFKIAYVARYHPQKNHKLLFKSISLYKKNIVKNLNYI